MKYVAEMGSCAKVYLPGFIDWFSHSKVDIGGYTDSMEIA
jgi:hypothetical protein